MTRPFLAPGCSSAPSIVAPPSWGFNSPFSQVGRSAVSSPRGSASETVSETVLSQFLLFLQSCVHQFTGTGALLPCPCSQCAPRLCSPQLTRGDTLGLHCPLLLEAQGLCSPAHLLTVSTGALFSTAHSQGVLLPPTSWPCVTGLPVPDVLYLGLCHPPTPTPLACL